MSMPPRSRTGSGPLIAGLLIVLAIVIALVAFAATGITPQRLWDGFFPIGNQTPVTDRSLSTKALYDFVFYIAAAIFLLVEGLIIYSAFRFRRKPGDDELPPQTHGNNLVEIVWTLIPTVIVAVLFVLSWQTLNVVDAKVTTSVHVTAVAARFQWAFEYRDGDGKLLFTQSLPVRNPDDPESEGGGLFLPVGEPIQIDLRSEDVIHAFYVPKFLFKRDVVPGKLNTFDFTVDEAGTYRGQCAELCGTFHGSMVFDVHAVDRPTFDAWVAEQVDKARATPAPPPSGGPSGAPAGTVVPLSAQNIAFSTATLQAPAGQPFTIDFKNDDQSVPHNVEIQDASGAVKLKGDTITGVAEIQYPVDALPAGDYKFLCTVHPNMTGTLTVQ
jgi:cytochrome c oxidase subunit II